jgi:ribosomal protein S6
MTNYEIMLVIDGNLSNEQAQESIKELTSIIDKFNNYKFTDLGNRDIAYSIKGNKKG